MNLETLYKLRACPALMDGPTFTEHHAMTLDTLSKLPDWPALMDGPTAIRYLGGSRASLDQLEAEGYLQRYANGHKSVRYLKADIDTALAARSLCHR